MSTHYMYLDLMTGAVKVTPELPDGTTISPDRITDYASLFGRHELVIYRNWGNPENLANTGRNV